MLVPGGGAGGADGMRSIRTGAGGKSSELIRAGALRLAGSRGEVGRFCRTAEHGATAHRGRFALSKGGGASGGVRSAAGRR